MSGTVWPIDIKRIALAEVGHLIQEKDALYQRTRMLALMVGLMQAHVC
jgi:hypothetical protein